MAYTVNRGQNTLKTGNQSTYYINSEIRPKIQKHAKIIILSIKNSQNIKMQCYKICAKMQ